MIPEAFKKEGIGKGMELLAGFLIATILTKPQADETTESPAKQ
jgi:hypothetical protein